MLSMSGEQSFVLQRFVKPNVCSETIQKDRIEDLMDEMMNEKEEKELKEAEECCRKFLMWNLEYESKHGSLAVREKLDSVLGRCGGEEEEIPFAHVIE